MRILPPGRAGRLLAGLVVIVVVFAGSSVIPPVLGSAVEEAADPLAARGYGVTSGAAPGYVDDRVCASCHPDLYESYQEVGMAKSFYRPGPEKIIEDLEGPGYFHDKSGRHYRMSVRDGSYVFERYQVDALGQRWNVLEQRVDWILGSGSHSRTYLYQTPEGELYQLPLAWYSQTGSWGMAPGYDRPDHEGVSRRVRRECMFCHNAYPEVAAGSDRYDAPQVYPERLPEGLGCQRCHGPGARHARIGMSAEIDFGELADSIVNPGNLPRRLLDDVCYGCHLQPTVALPGVRRFGRGDYSFRPGEPLSDYLVQVDVDEDGEERSERFEINHHPYRLEQSRCFTESEGALSCLTCHDPHRKVPEPERPAHYRAACETCHTVDSCRLQELGLPREISTMVDASGDAGLPDVDPGNCAACHMEKRRTQDVVRVVMTDHFIRRRPLGEILRAPLEESEPILVDIELQDDRAPGDALGEAYRAAAVVRVGGGANAVDHLAKMLEAARVAEVDPWIDLAKGQHKLGRLAAAEKTYGLILERAPEHSKVPERRAILLNALGRKREAVESLGKALELHPDGATARFNLGQLSGDPAAAAAYFEQALELHPNLLLAHYYLGEAQRKRGRSGDAMRSYRRALEIEPSHVSSYLALARLLLDGGDRDAASGLLRHAAATVPEPAAIHAALERISALPTEPESR